jgi:hypothetical protein
MTTPVAGRDPVNAVAKSRRYVVLLLLVSTVSFMDRQILAILREPFKRHLGASDTEMGLLTGFAFVLFFALASVPIARGRPVLEVQHRCARANVRITTMVSWYVAPSCSSRQ